MFLSYYQILSNAAISLVSYIGGPAGSEGPDYFSGKVDVDHPLDVKNISGKFDCIWSYGVRTHSEQTDIFLYIYRYRLATP